MNIRMLLLFALMIINPTIEAHATESLDSQETKISIQKSRLAAIDFLQPIIDRLEEEAYSFNQEVENPRINQLKKIQTSIFKGLSGLASYGNSPDEATENFTVTGEEDTSILIEAISRFSPEIQLGELKQKLSELKSAFRSKAPSKGSLLFIVELREQIREAALSQIYGASSQENLCDNCHKGRVVQSKVLGDTVKECLFCGHEEILTDSGGQEDNVVAIDVSEYFKQWASLQHLNLSHSFLNDSNLDQVLGLILSEGSVIETLDLSFNAIGDDGAWTLLTYLDGTKNLTGIDLRNNQITDKGAQYLIESLSDEKLQVLNLKDNPEISPENFEALNQLLLRLNETKENVKEDAPTKKPSATQGVSQEVNIDSQETC